MSYNRRTFMEGTPTRRLPLRIRPLVVILLAVCLGASESSRPLAQQASAPQPFPLSAWAAIAHGQIADAEAQARSRPGDDPEAAAILGHLAMPQRRLRRGAASCSNRPQRRRRSAAAALELGLLQQRLGRTEAATRAAVTLFRQGARASDPHVLGRAARAAQALGGAEQARRQHALSRRGIEQRPRHRNRVGLAVPRNLDRDRSGEVVPEGAGGGPALGPRPPGLAARARRREPAGRRGGGDASARDRSGSRRGRTAARGTRARQHALQGSARTDRHACSRAIRSICRRARCSAAIAYVKDDRAGLRRGSASACSRSIPAFGELYRVAGDLAARNYRFDDAVALTRTGGGARSVVAARARRSRHAPAAHRGRGRGAARARALVQRSTRSTASPTTC